MEKTIQVIDLNGVEVLKTKGTVHGDCSKFKELVTCLQYASHVDYGDFVEIKLRVAI